MLVLFRNLGLQNNSLTYEGATWTVLKLIVRMNEIRANASQTVKQHAFFKW